MTIHFVCRGNVYRSRIADAYLKSLQVPGITVMSSGTVADRDRASNARYSARTMERLQAHGLGPYAKNEPEQLTQGRLDDSDMLIFSNQAAYDEAAEHWRIPGHAIVWDIPDMNEGQPTPPTIEAWNAMWEDTYQKITQLVDDLVARRPIGLSS